MADLYLQAIMQGKIIKKNSEYYPSLPLKKNRFEIEIEKEIESRLINLIDEDPSHHKFNSPEIKKAKLKAQLLEDAKLSELSQFIDFAFNILATQSVKYLKQAQVEILMNDLALGDQILDEIDLNSVPSANFQTLLHFSDITVESMLKIAYAKFQELQLFDSLTLFVLLAILAPENSNYWLCAGILAQQSENYELANRLYHAAITTDPKLASAWFFSMECYLNRDMQLEAKTAYEELKRISDSFPLEEPLQEMLTEYEYDKLSQQFGGLL